MNRHRASLAIKVCVVFAGACCIPNCRFLCRCTVAIGDWLRLYDTAIDAALGSP